jgi:phosphohistidine phosphatase
MRLYLVQHGDAKLKKEDPSRPLSNKGWKDIRNMTEYAQKHLHIQVPQIFHSGKLRAKQTAEVLAEQLHPAKGVSVAEGLEPLADPMIWKNRLTETTEDIMLVGHLPHLEKLTGHLLAGDENKQVVAFRNAGIVCLERGESGGWAIRWTITPEIIP